MTRTSKTHYTVPEFVAYDIVENPPPPGMVVNCISCWNVSRQGLPDKHTVAWYPLFKTPASAKQRAREMTGIAAIVTKEPRPFVCTCAANDNAGIGEHHSRSCEFYCPF